MSVLYYIFIKLYIACGAKKIKIIIKIFLFIVCCLKILNNKLMMFYDRRRI